MQESFWDRMLNIMFRGLWVLIVILSVFIFFSIHGECASNNSGKLPIRTGETNQYFSLTEDSLGIDPQTVFETAHTFLCNTYNIDSDSDYFVLISDINYNSYLTGRWRFFMTFVFNPTYPANINDSSNYLQQNMVFEGDIYGISYDWQYNVPSTLATMNYGPQQSTSVTIYGPDSRQIDYTTNVNNVGSKSISYVPRFVVLYSGDGIYSANDKLVLTNSAGGIINPSGNIGQVIDPSLFNNYNNVSDTFPTAPTINNYTWNTYNSPPIDTTNLESLVESLIDVVNYGFNYLKDNISGSINNLQSNLSSLFHYLGDLVNYGFKSIQNTINSGIQNLVDNFKSLFQPLVDYVNYIIQPFDSNIIYDNISETTFISQISDFTDCIDSFTGVFTEVSEPNTFQVPIHLENLNGVLLFRDLQTSYINFDLILPYRDTIRGFIWAFTTFGLFITIIDSIANYINGGGDE